MRRATPDDKLEVLALNDNVYGGRDYLPALYDSFMSSSNMDPFVLLINGKIVSSSARIQRWGQGVRTPLKNHKFIGFPSNTGTDPLKITKLPS